MCFNALIRECSMNILDSYLIRISFVYISHNSNFSNFEDMGCSDSKSDLVTMIEIDSETNDLHLFIRDFDRTSKSQRISVENGEIATRIQNLLTTTLVDNTFICQALHELKLEYSRAKEVIRNEELRNFGFVTQDEVNINMKC